MAPQMVGQGLKPIWPIHMRSKTMGYNGTLWTEFSIHSDSETDRWLRDVQTPIKTLLFRKSTKFISGAKGPLFFRETV